MSFITQFITSPRFTFETDLDTLTVQDVVNGLRLQEYSFTGMSYPSLLNASGKQVLGGGALVGITYQGLNHELAFASERAPAHVGSITTADTTIEPRVIPSLDVIDITATFETDGVVAGSFVINYTDRSVADVIEVVSETQLRVNVPMNGSDNLYDLADVIHVFNIQTKRVQGGNTTAVDDLGGSIDPVHGTFGVLALIEQATSAALLDPDGLSTSITDTALLRKLLTNRAEITVNGDSTRTIDLYDDDQTTIIETLTISATGLTRTNP